MFGALGGRSLGGFPGHLGARRRQDDQDLQVTDQITGFDKQMRQHNLALTQDANSLLMFLMCIPLAAFVWVMFKAMWFWKAWGEFLIKTEDDVQQPGTGLWSCPTCQQQNHMTQERCTGCGNYLPELERALTPEPLPLQRQEVVLVLGLKAAPQFNGTQATVLDPGENETGNILLEFETGTQAYVKPGNVVQVTAWTVEDVATWLEKVHGGAFIEYIEPFMESGVDGPYLLQLDSLVLRELTKGCVGNRKHFRSLLEQLRPPIPVHDPHGQGSYYQGQGHHHNSTRGGGYQDPLLRDDHKGQNVPGSVPGSAYGGGYGSTAGHERGISDFHHTRQDSQGYDQMRPDSLASYPTDHSFDDMFTTFHLSFKHLTLNVPDKRTKLSMIDRIKMLSDDADIPTLQILNDVSGYFQPGTLTAIMGPSGCGKTTLLKLLSGRIMEGKLDGIRMINGEVLNSVNYDSVMSCQGFVQQFDTFFERLTVMEELTYAAMLRLPDTMPLFHKFHRIQSALREVGLQQRADANIGGSKNGSGISGGERRRLSVAIELLRMPSLIFLDEPTSGLDASSSLSIVRLLKNLAEGRRTVVTTIHQPRTEIFRMFDKILLMDKGGRLLCLASPQECLKYVRDAQNEQDEPDDGSNVESEPFVENPADVIIDAVQKAGGNFFHLTNGSQRTAQVLNDIDNACAQYRADEGSELPLCIPPRFITQTWVLFARRFSCVYTSGMAYILFMLEIIITELVIALAFSYDAEDQISPAYKLVMFLLIITSYAMVLQYLTLVPEYYTERPILIKDLNSGVSREDAYIAGVFLTELPTAVMHSTVLIVFGMFLADMNTEPHYAIFSFLTMLVGTSAWQSVISVVCVLTDQIENVYTVLFFILGLGCLFGGIMVSRQNIIKIFLFAYYMSVPALTTRAIVHNDLYCCHLTMTCEDWLEMQGFDVDDEGECPDWLDEDNDQNLVTEGNLGRAALEYLGFIEESKIAIVFSLFGLAIVFRFMSIIILKWKRRRSKRLHA